MSKVRLPGDRQSKAAADSIGPRAEIENQCSAIVGLSLSCGCELGGICGHATNGDTGPAASPGGAAMTDWTTQTKTVIDLELIFRFADKNRTTES